MGGPGRAKHKNDRYARKRYTIDTVVGIIYYYYYCYVLRAKWDHRVLAYNNM